MAKPSDLRIAVVVDEDSLTYLREWTQQAEKLMAVAADGIRDLTRHLDRGVPPLYATIDPTVEIEDEA